MRKRLTAAFLVAIVAAGLFILTLSGCQQNEPAEETDGVTRSEWVQMLSDTFGMDTPVSDEPYYEDISASDELFDSVQSAADWGVLAPYSAGTFDKDSPVTWEEVATTSAIMAGFEITEDQFGEDGSFDPSAAIEYALENGLIDPEQDLSQLLDADQLAAAVSDVQEAYLNAPVTDYSYVDYSDSIVDLSSITSSSTDSSGSDITIGPGAVTEDANGETSATIDTETGTTEVHVGDIIIMPATKDDPAGVARKVIAIEEKDGQLVVITEEPALEDLFEELQVSQEVSVSASDIIWSNGVSASASGMAASGLGEYHISLLSGSSEARTASAFGIHTSEFSPILSKSMGNFHNTVTFASGNVNNTWTNQNVNVGDGEGAQLLENSNFEYTNEPSIEDFNGSTEPWERPLTAVNKFSGGYKITGDISINAITVTADVDLGWTGLKKAVLKVDSDITVQLTLEGNLSEELTIATIPVPIPGTPLSVSIDLNLYVDASGKLVVTAGLGGSAKVEYQKGAGLRNSASSSARADVDASIQISFGAQLGAYLKALGIKVVNANVKVGGLLTASAYVGGNCEVNQEDGMETLRYQESMNIQSDLYIPIISVTAGGSDTLVGKLGLTKTWDIMTKDNTKHIELLKKEWVFWEQIVTTDEDGNVISDEIQEGIRDESDNAEQDETRASDPDRLDLTSYTVTVPEAGTVQLELSLDEEDGYPEVTWTSSNNSVALVDDTGLVIPMGEGAAVITVSLKSDPSVYARCIVYVSGEEEHDWEFLPPDTVGTGSVWKNDGSCGIELAAAWLYSGGKNWYETDC